MSWISNCATNFSLASIIVRFGRSFEDFVVQESFFVIQIMLFIILYILAHPILLFLFFRTTKEFPKSWWEFKFEVRTILCGFRSQNEDFFLRRRNKISWVNLLVYFARSFRFFPRRRAHQITASSGCDNWRKPRNRHSCGGKVAKVRDDCRDGWQNFYLLIN